MKFVIAYVSTAVIFFALDFVWLTTMSGSFYRQHVGALLLDKPNLTVGALFYLVYVGGIVFFAVNPALSGGGWMQAALAGLVLGLVAYGTYDFTNLSTLKGWSWTVSLVDLGWGMALSAVAATGGFWVTSWLAK